MNILNRAAEVMAGAAETDTWFWRRVTIWLAMTACFFVWSYLIIAGTDDETTRAEFDICGWVMGLCVCLHVLGPKMEGAISNISSRFGRTSPARNIKPKAT